MLPNCPFLLGLLEDAVRHFYLCFTHSFKSASLRRPQLNVPSFRVSVTLTPCSTRSQCWLQKIGLDHISSPFNCDIQRHYLSNCCPGLHQTHIVTEATKNNTRAVTARHRGSSLTYTTRRPFTHNEAPHCNIARLRNTPLRIIIHTPSSQRSWSLAHSHSTVL